MGRRRINQSAWKGALHMRLRRTLTLMGFGAALMYFYDPEDGSRRRARLRDQWNHIRNETRDFWGKARRDLMNRREGLRSDPGSLFKLPGELGGASGEWTPGMRLVSALAGGGMTFYGLLRGGLQGTAATLIGLNLVSRGVANTGLRGLLGIGSSADTIDFDIALTVNAPAEEAFDFWRNYANFPRFMSLVREVRDLGNGRSHWVVEGPAGTTAEWDATVTDMQPNRLLAWESAPGSPVRTMGHVRFDEQAGGCTRIHVHLSYRPPAGSASHVVASLFGPDPKSAMDEDMLRLKSLIESTRATSDGREAAEEQVTAQQPQVADRPSTPTHTSSAPPSRGARHRKNQSLSSQQGGADEPASSRPANSEIAKAEKGISGSVQGGVDQVGQTGAYPADDPEVVPAGENEDMAHWGQGEGAAGDSETSPGNDPTARFSSVVPGQPDNPEEGD
jgi:uncharacterized membrane protein